VAEGVINGLLPSVKPLVSRGGDHHRSFFAINMLGGAVRKDSRAPDQRADNSLPSSASLSWEGVVPLTDIFNPAGQISQLVTLAIWLYIGIEFVCPMSEEIRNPERMSSPGDDSRPVVIVADTGVRFATLITEVLLVTSNDFAIAG